MTDWFSFKEMVFFSSSSLKYSTQRQQFSLKVNMLCCSDAAFFDCQQLTAWFSLKEMDSFSSESLIYSALMQQFSLSAMDRQV